MKIFLLATLLCCSVSAQISTAPAAVASGKLTAYFVDVEGGQATLFVSPAGESLLIDTGWSTKDDRDAIRIADAANLAGLTRIDYVLFTHYHFDHVSGIAALVQRIPVGTYIDHGPNREPNDSATAGGYAMYQKLLAANLSRHLVLHPGDHLPIRGFDAIVISADGNLIDKPLPGAGKENPACKTSEAHPADQTENARSLGIEITFGKLKILDLGDLTWDKEMQLQCPFDKIGHVDLFVVSHHGLNQSNSPALVHAIHPRVAIMDNGATKGGNVLTFQTLAASPGLDALFQLHYSNVAGKQYNQPDPYIANLPGPDTGHFLQLTASADGSFAILNARTGQTQTYPAR